jgi:hypothetical protein
MPIGLAYFLPDSITVPFDQEDGKQDAMSSITVQKRKSNREDASSS